MLTPKGWETIKCLSGRSSGYWGKEYVLTWVASIHAKLKRIDEWLRNRLRYCIWSRLTGRRSLSGNANLAYRQEPDQIGSGPRPCVCMEQCELAYRGRRRSPSEKSGGAVYTISGSGFLSLGRWFF